MLRVELDRWLLRETLCKFVEDCNTSITHVGTAKSETGEWADEKELFQLRSSTCADVCKNKLCTEDVRAKTGS